MGVGKYYNKQGCQLFASYQIRLAVKALYGNFLLPWMDIFEIWEAFSHFKPDWNSKLQKGHLMYSENAAYNFSSA